MAWNPSPEVAVARDACKKFPGAVQCIVIWLTEDNIGMASYGQTKALCNEAGELGNVAYDCVMREIEARDYKRLMSNDTMMSRETQLFGGDDE